MYQDIPITHEVDSPDPQTRSDLHDSLANLKKSVVTYEISHCTEKRRRTAPLAPF